MNNTNRINPVGPKGFEVVDRMKQLMGESVDKQSKNYTVELTKKGPDGIFYAIVKENHNYFIKKTSKTENILAEDFDYIGGLSRKMDNAYPSYAKALKQLNIKFFALTESLDMVNEANLFADDNVITETIQPKTVFVDEDSMKESVDDENDIYFTGKGLSIGKLIQSEVVQPVKKKSLTETKYKLKLGDVMPDQQPAPSQASVDVPPPSDNQPVGDTEPELPPVEDENPFDKPKFDAGVDVDEEEDPKKFIQQLSGKLGQSLRKYNDEQGQPDYELEKFAINSVVSATHAGSMSEEDRNDIINKLRKAGVDSNDTQGEQPVDNNQDAEVSGEVPLENNPIGESFRRLSVKSKINESVQCECELDEIIEELMQDNGVEQVKVNKPVVDEYVPRRIRPFVFNKKK